MWSICTQEHFLQSYYFHRLWSLAQSRTQRLETYPESDFDFRSDSGRPGVLLMSVTRRQCHSKRQIFFSEIIVHIYCVFLRASFTKAGEVRALRLFRGPAANRNETFRVVDERNLMAFFFLVKIDLLAFDIQQDLIASAPRKRSPGNPPVIG